MIEPRGLDGDEDLARPRDRVGEVPHARNRSFAAGGKDGAHSVADLGIAVFQRRVRGVLHVVAAAGDGEVSFANRSDSLLAWLWVLLHVLLLGKDPDYT
jgi:hypothetical protein